MPGSSSVLIYVQHLLGVGHLQRSLQLAAGLEEAGFEVELVSGGRPTTLPLPKNVTVHQLPPVYSPDGSFSRLLDINDQEIDQHWREQRKQQLLDIFARSAPQVLITETFPFGRRMMRFELMPLLEAARARVEPVEVVASVRDILQPKSRPGRNQEICALVDRYYDHVLVHGDARINRLEDSFSDADKIADKVAYSGYISTVGADTASVGTGLNEVLVSAGGSATGIAILKAAIAARPVSCLRQLNWRILVSPSIDDQQFAELQRQSEPGISVERNRPDFSALMRRARLSISQAGYNTVIDILNSEAAAVVVPYAEANEIEQTMRAQTLQRLERLVMLDQDELSVATLCTAIEQACQQQSSLRVDLAGASRSAALISQWLTARGVN